MASCPQLTSAQDTPSVAEPVPPANADQDRREPITTDEIDLDREARNDEAGNVQADNTQPGVNMPTANPAPRDGAPEVLPETTGVENAASTARQAQPRARLLVLQTGIYGIDPIVGSVTTTQLRETAEAVGYTVVTQTETTQAARQLQMPFPPTPADLWRVSWVARVHRGVFARVWAHAGEYVIEVVVASLDGTGPFFARGTSGASNLRERVDALLRDALPLPQQWHAAGMSRHVNALQSSDDFEEDWEQEEDWERHEAPRQQTNVDANARRDNAPHRQFDLGIQTEAAFGASANFFYNHLLGIRFDYRITPTLIIGASLSYINLEARNGRADNLLLSGQFEYRIRVARQLDLTVPLKFAVGFLPNNGPVFRGSVGFNYAVSDDWELGLDILAPTLWALSDRVPMSLNVALEALYRF